MKFTIRGTLPNLNDYITAERTNRYQAAAMKKQCESIVMHAARSLGKWRGALPWQMAGGQACIHDLPLV